MTDKSELHERGIEAAYHAWCGSHSVGIQRQRDAIAAYLAIAPQEAVSAVREASPPAPVDADAIIERCAKVADDKAGEIALKAQDVRYSRSDRLYFGYDAFDMRSLANEIRALKSSPPAQADDGKHTLIRELMAEKPAVDFEAAWAAFQNCPIDGALDDEDNMRAALRAALAIDDGKDALIRELVAALGDVKAVGYRMAFAKVEDALAKAKSGGYSNEGKDNG